MKLSFIISCIGLLIFLSSSNLRTRGEVGPHAVEIDSNRVLYPIDYSKLRARDPYILADQKSKTYYLVVNKKPNFKVYSSKDLKNWRDEGNCFVSTSDFWGEEDFWAPDLVFYRGKYYILATFSSETSKRGTSILVADKPTGPFMPLVNHAVTPADWMALDGTLYIDEEDNPWIIYCHEWLEVEDGEIVAQRLSEDLKTTVGKPHVLFTGNSAPWTGTISAGSVTGYVTDAPFPYKAKNGELLMLWSSFTKSGKYAIGVARSKSGSILGPWVQDDQPLNNDDGGHAMLFKDFSGNLMISYHAPNSKAERPVLYKVKEENGKLLLF